MSLLTFKAIQLPWWLLEPKRRPEETQNGHTIRSTTDPNKTLKNALKKVPLGALKGSFWGPLGPPQGSLGGLLGTSCGHFGHNTAFLKLSK